MSELTLQWIQVLKLVTLGIYASLYAFGGMHGKWKRRWIAPFILTVGICLLSLWSGTFSWWFVGYFPLLSAALHLGYGADEFLMKLIKRSYVGLALACAAVPIAVGTGAWSLLAFHALICVGTSVALGVFNITSSARAEETFIAVMTCALPLAMF